MRFEFVDQIRSSSSAAVGGKSFKSCLNSNVTFKRASSSTSSEFDIGGGFGFQGHERFLASIENWTLANEGLKRSIFGLGGVTGDLSLSTIITSCNGSDGNDGNDDVANGLGSDGQSICSGSITLDIEYKPPTAATAMRAVPAWPFTLYTSKECVITNNAVVSAATQDDACKVVEEKTVKEEADDSVTQKSSDFANDADDKASDDPVDKGQKDDSKPDSSVTDADAKDADAEDADVEDADVEDADAKWTEDVLENVNVRERRKLFLNHEFRLPSSRQTTATERAAAEAIAAAVVKKILGSNPEIAMEVKDEQEEEEPHPEQQQQPDTSFVSYIVSKFDGISKSATV